MKNQNRKTHRWIILSIAVSIVVACAIPVLSTKFANEKIVPQADVATPLDIDQLEPDVRTLIQQRIERTRTNPHEALCHGDLGLAFEANGLWTEAEKSYTNAVELDPGNLLWRLHLAIAKNEVGDFSTSLTLLRAIVSDAPDFVAAQQRFGHASLQENDLISAEAAFQRVIELAPQAAEGYAGLADVHLRQSRVESAIKLLEKSISLDGRYRVPHFLLGMAYRKQGRLDLAAREISLGQQGKVRYLSDEHSTKKEEYALSIRARHQRGIRQMTTGKFAEAAATLEATHRAAPRNIAVMNLLAGAYMQLGRQQDGFRLLQTALQVDDKNATTHINLASWYLHSGQAETALQHAETAVTRADWLLSAHRVRIQALIRLTRFAEAQNAVDRALRIAPKDASLQRLARQLEKRLNRPSSLHK